MRRRVRKRCRESALLRLSFEPLEDRRVLAVLTVTSEADSGDGSLREAVLQANANPGHDTIDFDPGVAQVELQSELAITDALEVRGPGAANLTISGRDATRILRTVGGADLTVVGLTLDSGRAAAGTNGFGGAILNQAGSELTLRETVVSNSQAEVGGGAIANLGGGSLHVVSSTLTSNSSLEGGGVYNSGSLIVVNSTLSSNSASGDGGGIFQVRGKFAVGSSTIVANIADTDGLDDDQGGGIYVNTLTSEATLNNSIVAGNLQGADGSELPSDVVAVGGGLSFTSQNNVIGDAATAGGLFHGFGGNRIGVNGLGTRFVETILDVGLSDNGGGTPTHALPPGSQALNSSAGLITDLIDDAEPIHWWRFEEPTGSNTAADSVGDLHGTYSDATVVLESPGGLLGLTSRAASFDAPEGFGGGGLVEVRAPGPLPALPAGSLSIESWVNVDSFQSGGGVISVLEQTTTTQGWALRTQANGTVEFVVKMQGADDTTSVTADGLETGQWYHVVATYDGADVRLYVDGVERDSSPATGPIEYPPNSSGGMTIGAVRDTSQTLNFDGRIDEIVIYDDALDAFTVAAHFASGLVPPLDQRGMPRPAGAGFDTGSFELNARDYGDAPTAQQSGFISSYPTELAENGAYHEASRLFFGFGVDAESDGQPAALAGQDIDGGDDNNGFDDDDGVFQVANLIALPSADTTSSFSLLASEAGFVDAWIDFNQDGDWDDAGEQVSESTFVVAGENVLPVTVPAGAHLGDTAARFRISSTGGLAPTGRASDGEVEDYYFTIGDGESGVALDVLLPLRGASVEIADDELSLELFGVELFRAPVGAVTGINVFDTVAAQTLDLAGVKGVLPGPVTVHGQANDAVSLDFSYVEGFGEVIDGVTFRTFSNGLSVVKVAPLVRVDRALPLDSLGGFFGITMFGDSETDATGNSVSSAGDVNGDGYDDVVIAAVGSDIAADNAGRSYLVFGRAAWADIDSLAANSVVIDGLDPQDAAGSSVSSAGDVNGDGFDDLLIGAAGGAVSENAKPFAGESYLIFGKSDWSTTPTIDLANLGTTGVTILGADTYDNSGAHLSSAGDINGDGLDDFLVTALRADVGDRYSAGETYVIFGKTDWATTPTLDLSDLDDDGVTLAGSDAFDYSGVSATGVGDVNGDGLDDLLVGASGGDGPEYGQLNRGEAYLIFGRDDWLTPPAEPDVRINGVDSGDLTAASVSNAGDVNGDGFNDLFIAASGGDGGYNTQYGAGAAYLVFGNDSWAQTPSLDLATLGNAGVTFLGADAGDAAGVAVSAAGDTNGDGFDDLLIGAQGADGGGENRGGAGETYVVFGKQDWSTTPFVSLGSLGSLGITLPGVDAADYSGSAVSGAGDVNGDGFDDLLIGASAADSTENAVAAAGEAYLVFGADYTTSATQVGGVFADTLLGSLEADVLIGGLNNDSLFGGGGGDSLRGGQGNDLLSVGDLDFHRVSGGSGFDTLRFEGIPTINLAQIRDNRILSIEGLDITRGGPTTLTFDYGEVLNLSDDSNALFVTRNTEDTVNFGSGWSLESDETVGGVRTEVFSQGVAMLTLQTIHPDFGDAPDPYPTTLPNGAAHQPGPLFLGSLVDSELDGQPDEIAGAGDTGGDDHNGFDDDDGVLLVADPVVLTTHSTTTSIRVFPSAAGFVDAWIDFNQDGDWEDNGEQVLQSAAVFAGENTLTLHIPAGATAAETFGRFRLSSAGGLAPNGLADDGEVEDYYFTLKDGNAGADVDVLLPDGDAAILVEEGDLVVRRLTQELFRAPTSGITSLRVFAPIPASTIDVSELPDTLTAPVIIHGGADDNVILATDFEAGPSEHIDGITFQTFANGDMSIKVSASAGLQAGISRAVPLASLGEGVGVTLFGASEFDGSGIAVRGVGDVNDDGLGDFLIGASGADSVDDSRANAGESYLIFGRADWTETATLDLSDLGSAGVVLLGAEAGDYSGVAVSGAGDVNGDGFNDLVIGARGGDGVDDDETAAGESYLVFGREVWPSQVDLAALGTDGVTLFGADAYDNSGVAVASAGDVNGDGFEDLIIGSPGGDGDQSAANNAGEAYIVFGKQDWTATPTVDLGSLGAGGITIFGNEAYDAAGTAVSGAGDVNGDGFDDLIVGAPYADGPDNARAVAGESYIIFGGDDLPGTLDLAAAGLPVLGADFSDLSGISVSGAGDLNGDGFDDLLIGANGGDRNPPTEQDSGETYIIFGRADLEQAIAIDLGLLDADVAIFGADRLDGSGGSVTSAGDVNNDGFADLLIGANRADSGGDNRLSSGESYLVFGKENWPSFIDLFYLRANGRAFHGSDTGDYSGAAVSGAGDVNGDGFGDFLIGAPGGDGAGETDDGAGETYLIFGGDYGPPPVELDYGDAPTAAQSSFANDYPTTVATGGAAHEIDGGLFLGFQVDGESDGPPDAGAVGDDQLGLPDEDGVAAAVSAIALANTATTSSFIVTASLAGKLDAWIDFDQSGSWEQSEQVFVSLDVVAGANSLSYTVPAGASPGTTFARFRLSALGGLGPTGLAVGGEVEDHLVTILDGDANGGLPSIDVASGSGEIEVLADGAHVVARSGGAEIFRAPGNSLTGQIEFHGTAGDDVLSIDSLSDVFAGAIVGDAGTGTDTVRLTGSGQTFDPTLIAAGAIQGIDVIDITGTGGNTLVLDAGVVQDISDANELVVHADIGDSVDVGPGWSLTGMEVVDGRFFRVLEQGDARVLLHGPSHWTNPLSPFDVNASGTVEPLDVLLIINEITSPQFTGPDGRLVDPATIDNFDNAYRDVSGDGLLAPFDVLLVIDFFVRGAGEGEGPVNAQVNYGVADQGGTNPSSPSRQLVVEFPPSPLLEARSAQIDLTRPPEARATFTSNVDLLAELDELFDLDPFGPLLD